MSSLAYYQMYFRKVMICGININSIDVRFFVYLFVCFKLDFLISLDFPQIFLPSVNNVMLSVIKDQLLLPFAHL